MVGVEGLPLTSIGIVLSLALLLSLVAKKVGLNPLLGFILSGFLLGPFVLNFLSPSDPLIFAFSEIGLFVILFYLGMELSLKEFIKAAESSIGLAVLDMVFLMIVGVAVCLALGFSPLFAVVVGLMLFSTSSAIVGKFILDHRMIEQASSRVALAILILQDFLGILLLVFITTLQQGGESPIELGLTSLVFATAAFYAVHAISKRAEKFFDELGLGVVEITLYALGIGFVVATLGSLIGVSTALGAYFAGFALSETKSGSRIKKELSFLREFFLMFFFVSFGTTLFFNKELGIAQLPAMDVLLFLGGFVALLVAIGITIHTLVFTTFGPLFGMTRNDSVKTAALLIPLGEFVIIIATTASYVLSSQEASILAPVAFLLIIFTLFLFQPIFSHREQIEKFLEKVPALFNVRVKKTDIEKPTEKEAVYLRKIAINLFLVLCLIRIAFLLLGAIPTLNILPIPYGRELTAAIVVILLAIWPIMQTYKYAKLFFNGMRNRVRQAVVSTKRQVKNSD